MLDKERILIKIDELKGYLEELKEVMPEDFNTFQKIEKKRSCERILQLCVECTIDICKIIVSGLKLGVPHEENDLFDKLYRNNIINKDMKEILKSIRGFRNILIHEYAKVDDEIVFNCAKNNKGDFEKFIIAILQFLRSENNLFPF